MLSKLKLSTKVVAQSVIVIICFMIVLGWVLIMMKDKMLNEKTTATKNIVDVAYSIIVQYDDRVKKGEMQQEEGQKRAAMDIKNLRYAGKEYFWINDLQPKVIMHPFNLEMVGQDVTEKKDPKGKRFFLEFVNVCKAQGEGLVKYMWTKPGEKEPVDKVSYVKLYKPWGWIVGSGIYVDDVQNDFLKMFYIIAGVVSFIVVISLIFSILMTRRITRPLVAVIEGLSEAAGQIASASAEVSSSSQGLAEGTSSQASAVEETSASLEEMSSMAKQTSDNATQANRMSGEAMEQMKKARNSMKELIASIQDISKASEETQKIVKTIDEISFQTNLLALNAAVEAARAGEAGAGFAVVADEVRNLAMRAAEAAKNTSELIEGISKKIQSGNQLIIQTDSWYRDVAVTTKKVGEFITEIAEASKEQSLGVNQVAKAIAEIDKVTQQVAATAEENAAASEEMSAQAAQMNGFVIDLSTVIGRDVVSNNLYSLDEERRIPAMGLRKNRSVSVQGNGSGSKVNKTRSEKLIPFDGDEGFKDF